MILKQKDKRIRLAALAAALFLGFQAEPASVFAEKAAETNETAEAGEAAETNETAEEGEAAETNESAEIIYIDTVEDFLDFADRCTLDTWSQGKKAVLRADISLENIEFLPIPTFGGVFDGGGHQITGMDIDQKVSPAGLFGTLQESAVVKNLKVSGSVKIPDDHAGGVAGINDGQILDCSFDGSLSGKGNVGGIAGTNEEKGKIQNCRTSGDVQGSSMTGGVVGNNKGVVSSCVNRGNVNITSVDPGLNVNEMDFKLNQSLFQLSALDTVNVATDTGGIAGYSSGMTLSCTNHGTVGYQHIGYNVGGIAGRSSGYMFVCRNYGEVFGRKDIGGIAGQAEPDILLNLSADKLEQIRQELTKLEEMVAAAAEHTEASSSQTASRLTDIGNSVDTASSYAKNLSDQIAEYGNEVVEDVNRSGEIFSDTAEQLSQNGDRLTEMIAKITEGLEMLEQAVREMEQSGEFGEAALRDLQAAADDLDAVSKLMESSLARIAEGMKNLRDAVIVKDEAAVKNALAQIEDGSRKLAEALGRLESAIQKLEGALGTVPAAPKEVLAALRELKNAFADNLSAAVTLADGIKKLQENTDFNSQRAKEGLAQVREGLQSLQTASGQISQLMENLRNSLKNMEQMSEGMREAMGTLADSLAIFGEASVSGKEIMKNIDDLLSGLGDVNPVQSEYPSEAVGGMADALYASMGEINGHIKQLYADVSASSETLTSDFGKINSQFMTVMNLMLDMVHQLESGSEEERVSDTSEQDMDEVINGKVLSCSNDASIDGDINVGGIAGALAIEYEFDPEDDLAAEGAASYRKEYELKAILQKCVNSGNVTSRKDYAGGVCGRMDLGFAAGCESYGRIQSENGSYVGGIAGFSTGIVRGCFAKCSLAGKKYIGGIVGSGGGQDTESSAGKVQGCYSMVDIVSYEQYAGAVAGVDGGSYGENFFVSDSLAGIGRCSITGQAEPMEYKALLEVEGLPQQFRQLTVRFMEEENLIQQFSLNYGEGLDPKDFPAIPEREGYFSRWSEEELEQLHFDVDVEAVYKLYETALPSKAVREDGREVFFVEGQFDDRAKLKTRQLEEPSEGGGQEGEPELSGAGLPKGRWEECWQLEIPDDEAPSHMARYLSPDGKTKGWSVYVYQDGAWKNAKAKAVGSYLEFEVKGNNAYLAVVRRVGI